MFCDKIQSGVICTEFEAVDGDFINFACHNLYDETRHEFRLYDILRVQHRWVDYTECICGLIPDQSSSESGLSVEGSPVGSTNDFNDIDISGYITDYSEGVDFDSLLEELCVDPVVINASC